MGKLFHNLASSGLAGATGLVLLALACGPSDEELNRLIDQRAQDILAAAPTVTPQVIPTPLPTATAQPTASPAPAATLAPTVTPAPTATPAPDRYPGAYRVAGAYGYAPAHRDSGNFPADGHPVTDSYSGYLPAHANAGYLPPYTNTPAHGHAPASYRFPGDSPTRLAVGVYG